MTEIEVYLSEVRSDVESVLDRLLPAADVEPARLHEAIRWSVFGGGKRIRPAVLFAVGGVFEAPGEMLSGTAAAVEMIHTYSLIHDDLPSMDDDDLRRGRATCHKQFGEATAILAGDALQALAFKTIAEDDAVAPEERTRLISLLASAASTPDGMVAGQQLDLDGEDADPAIAQVEQIHRRKTGALIVAAAVSGAVIGDADDDEVIAITSYAEKLGLLFQVTDDLLDVTQPTGTLGKTAGKDKAANKATYAAHYGIDGAHAAAGQIAANARDALSTLNRDTKSLLGLIDFVAGRTR